jgi:ADP-ribose pyrophosphatase YjhB (NUDIX family)
MTLWRPLQHVRVIAIGLALREDRLLVFRVLDDAGALKGVRPPGGGVEFGERAADTLAREFREELATDIALEGPPVVLENLFDHEGARGHEVVFAYPVRLLDATIYGRPLFTIREDNGIDLQVEWMAMEALRTRRIALFPDGLLAAIG